MSLTPHDFEQTLVKTIPAYEDHPRVQTVLKDVLDLYRETHPPKNRCPHCGSDIQDEES